MTVEWIPMAQAAEEKGVSKTTIRNWGKQGKINLRKSGRFVEVARDEQFSNARPSKRGRKKKEVILEAPVEKKEKKQAADTIDLHKKVSDLEREIEMAHLARKSAVDAKWRAVREREELEAQLRMKKSSEAYAAVEELRQLARQNADLTKLAEKQADELERLRARIAEIEQENADLLTFTNKKADEVEKVRGRLAEIENGSRLQDNLNSAHTKINYWQSIAKRSKEDCEILRANNEHLRANNEHLRAFADTQRMTVEYMAMRCSVYESSAKEHARQCRDLGADIVELEWALWESVEETECWRQLALDQTWEFASPEFRHRSFAEMEVNLPDMAPANPPVMDPSPVWDNEEPETGDELEWELPDPLIDDNPFKPSAKKIERMRREGIIG